jgi:small GTP-binding protein
MKGDAMTVEKTVSDKAPFEQYSVEAVPNVAFRRTLEANTEWVGCLAFDAVTRTIASGSSDNIVKRWKPASGKVLNTYEVSNAGVWSVAFGPGGVLAAGCKDGTVAFWNAESGRRIRVISAHAADVNSVTFAKGRTIIATASDDQLVKLWASGSGMLLKTMEGHDSYVNSVTFDRNYRLLASGSSDNTVKIWSAADGEYLRTLAQHDGDVYTVAFDSTGEILASGSRDKTIKLWDAATGKLLRTLEGHTGPVGMVTFSFDGRLLLSKSSDGTIRFWSCEKWETIAILPEQSSYELWNPALALDATSPLPWLASGRTGADGPREMCEHINLWSVNVDALLKNASEVPTVHYTNAKVVLVGDTGVGKSGLSLVLNGKQFEATDSTPGRHVWTFDSREVAVEGHGKQTQETLLWDLAGQPGYRIIHQLHLNEVAVALVVFDARSDIDPLAGVRHWERALRVAHQRQDSHSVPAKRFLVSARADRGGVSVSKERIQAVREEFGFDGYFETSAREGWQITELRAAIEAAIPWSDLPVVTSEKLFERIKAFLLEVKKGGVLLAQAAYLYDEFRRTNVTLLSSHPNLAAQFETCIGRLENRDLIRGLSFGGYVLLQPELLDAYASALVIAAKNEPDGLGSIGEDIALAGKFYITKEQKIADRGQEQLLLHAMVEELVRHDLALRENADDGRYLVFPSQFNRDFEDAAEPKGLALAMTFEGPVQSLYSTLAVRVGHSGLFETGRTEMWRNAAIFTARAGGRCGMYMKEFAEARGQVLLFFEPDASDETRFYFEEYVLSHLTRRAIEGSVELIRFFVCAGCATPVPDAYVKMQRSKGVRTFGCPCGETVALVEPKDRLAKEFPSQVAASRPFLGRHRLPVPKLRSEGGDLVDLRALLG